VHSPEVRGGRVVDIVVDGLSIRTSVRGHGRPLLLIMGLGGNLGMWDQLERHLVPRGIQTIAFDAPGTGQSSAWRRPRRMPAIARVVDRVAGALG